MGRIGRLWRSFRESASILTLLACAFLVAYIAIFGYGIWWPWYQDYVVRTTGASAVGQIVDQRILGGTKHRDFLILVAYRPQDGGAERRGWANVDDSLYRRLGRGERVALRYLPAEPERIWIEGDDPGTLWGLIFSAPLLVVPLELGRMLRFAVREGWHARDGATALGAVVTLIEPPGWPDARLRRDLRYAFTDAAGIRREGLFVGLPNRIGVFTEPGDPILVDYNPQDPTRHRADVFSLADLSSRRRGRATDEREGASPAA